MKWLENTVKIESFVETSVRDLENELFIYANSYSRHFA